MGNILYISWWYPINANLEGMFKYVMIKGYFHYYSYAQVNVHTFNVESITNDQYFCDHVWK